MLDLISVEVCNSVFVRIKRDKLEMKNPEEEAPIYWGEKDLYDEIEKNAFSFRNKS